VAHSKGFGHGALGWIDVDADDAVGADQLAPWITLRPMPPRPKTTTFAPGSTPAVQITAPTPVVTPQPM
jgi:hypothetical protein